MNTYYLCAAILAFLLGLAHSLLGELLIFRTLRLRNAQLKWLSPRHLAALWSTWHLVTVLGWTLAAALLWMAFPPHRIATLGLILSVFLAACALFWLAGTKGKHPAWIVFLLMAGLTVLGATD